MKLVFVHGSGGCGAWWRFQSERFRDADAVDLPGHPEGSLLGSVEAYAKWLADHIERRGYEDVVVVGHSIGGAIAMLYALERPPVLRGIVPLGSGARLRVLPQTLEGLGRAVDDPSLFPGLMRGSFAKLDAALARELETLSLRVGPAAFLNDLRACDRFDVMERLPEIRVPMLAICGSEDVMTPPKYSRFLVERVAGAQLCLIEGGTHMVFLEQPERVNEAIAGFVDALERDALRRPGASRD